MTKLPVPPTKSPQKSRRMDVIEMLAKLDAIARAAETLPAHLPGVAVPAVHYYTEGVRRYLDRLEQALEQELEHLDEQRQ